MTTNDCRYNLKQGRCFPYKHNTISVALRGLDALDTLEKLREKLPSMATCISPDGQDLVQISDLYEFFKENGFDFSKEIIDEEA